MKATSSCSACWPAKRRSPSKTPASSREEQKKSTPVDADQQRLQPRHHHAESGRNASQDRRRDRKRARLRSHRHRHSRVLLQGIEIQAEAGARRDALGRRIVFGEGWWVRLLAPDKSPSSRRLARTHRGPSSQARCRPSLSRSLTREQFARRAVRRILGALRIRGRRNPAAAHPR